MLADGTRGAEHLNMAASVARSYVDSDSFPARDKLEIAREKLIVALDFSTIEQAREMVATLGDEVTFYKVGLGLQLEAGDQFPKELKRLNKRVFLDYKYYDIPETVKNAVARAADIGVDFLTVHGVTENMRSAVEGRGYSTMKLLCVTVLTSMDASDLQEMGYRPDITVEDVVIRRSVLALEAGIDGVIASAHEAEAIKIRTDNKLMVVTPGIRPDGAPRDDQKRVSPPRDAIKGGADYLVIGRPITNVNDPRRAARQIIDEMADAL
jgi:orotidine-5'-phosphate decarboxylase